MTRILQVALVVAIFVMLGVVFWYAATIVQATMFR